MSDELNPQFQLLQTRTCTPKSIIKTAITLGGNVEHPSQMFGRHGNLSSASSQATILQFSVGNFV
jgi:hypothetical protein